MSTVRMCVPVPDGVAGGISGGVCLENMPLAKDNSGLALVDRPHGAGTKCHPASWQGPSAPRSRPRLGFSGVSSVAVPAGVQGADLGSRLHFAAGREDTTGSWVSSVWVQRACRHGERFLLCWVAAF